MQKILKTYKNIIENFPDAELFDVKKNEKDVIDD